eukprot:scaffold172281_cov83-Cyclotella_meneghiniana.AAC.1
MVGEGGDWNSSSTTVTTPQLLSHGRISHHLQYSNISLSVSRMNGWKHPFEIATSTPVIVLEDRGHFDD